AEDGRHKVLGKEAPLQDTRRDRPLDAFRRQRDHQEERQVGEQQDPCQQNADKDPVGPALAGLEVLCAETGDHFWGVSVNSRNTSSSDCSETRSSLTSTPSETSRRLIDAACDGSMDSRRAFPSTRTCSGLTRDSTNRRA